MIELPIDLRELYEVLWSTVVAQRVFRVFGAHWGGSTRDGRCLRSSLMLLSEDRSAQSISYSIRRSLSH